MVAETPTITEVKQETVVQPTDKPILIEQAVKSESIKEEQKPAENGTSEEAGEDAPPKLFVGRLPVGTKDSALKELFNAYGEVTHCDIVGKYGFVVSLLLSVQRDSTSINCFFLNLAYEKQRRS